MSRRYAATMLVLLAIAVSSCSDQLGRSVPGCATDDNPSFGLAGGIIVEMQAVATAEYVPCISVLQQGWEYRHLVPERGISRFWLSSDRVGDDFLEVTLREVCDVAALPEEAAGSDGVRRYRNTALVSSTVIVTIAPTGDRTADFANTLESAIEAERFNGRRPIVVLDDRNVPLIEKIASAGRGKQPLIVIDEQDLITGTASLILPGEIELRRGMEINDLLDRIDGLLPRASLTGTWFDVFEGGCVEYVFGATGSGVDDLERDVEGAVGLFPAAELRSILRQLGVLV